LTLAKLLVQKRRPGEAERVLKARREDL